MKNILLKFSMVAAIIITAACSSQQNASQTSTRNYLDSPTYRVVYGPKGKIIKNEINSVEVSTSIQVEDAFDANQKDLFIDEANRDNQPSAIKKSVSKQNFSLVEKAHLAKSIHSFKSSDDFKHSKTQSIGAEKSSHDETTIVLYVLLSLLVPFGCVLAMYLYEGSVWTERVTVNLILSFLCLIPGIIHALVIFVGRK
jgi:uncharacterized membrane protein YqaE (UPF0057 family)